MRILVTGAGGQLGSALPRALAGHQVTALSRAELDIRDLPAVRASVRALGPELLINAAAYNAVDAAEIDPQAAADVNEVGPWNLAAATAEIDAALVHVSTDYVFDGLADSPYDEDAAPAPQSAYGRSKLAGEQAVRATNPRHFIVRTAWVYAAAGKNFPLTMLGLAKKGVVRVVDDQTGSPTYAPHLAEGIARLLAAKAPHGTYHLAGSGSASWYELTVALFERLGVDTPVMPVSTAEFPRPAPRPRYSVLRTIRQPRIELPPWREGLDAFARELTSAA